MPARDTQPFRELTGLAGRQKDVPFVIPDLGRDLRGGMYLTMALAKLSSRAVVKEMYATASDYFGLLNEFLKRARDGNAEAYTQARRIAAFPEARELGMGYARDGWDGSAVGDADLNLQIVETLLEYSGIAKVCADEPDTITFIKDIGLDRASDALATITKRHLAQFTSQMARDYLSPDCIQKATIPNAWNPEAVAFDTIRARVPLNDGQPILLVPKEIVRSSPPVKPIHYERRYYPTTELDKGELKNTIMEENRRDPTQLRKVVDEVLADPNRCKPRREYQDE